MKKQKTERRIPVRNWEEDLEESLIEELCKNLNQMYRRTLGTPERTGKEKDKQGIDVIITTPSSKTLLIDEKVLTPQNKRFYKKNFCIEIWSILEKKVKGWSWDEKHENITYFAWFWRKDIVTPLPDYYLIPRSGIQKWVEEQYYVMYKAKRAKTEGKYDKWTTKSAIVPIKDLREDLSQIGVENIKLMKGKNRRKELRGSGQI